MATFLGGIWSDPRTFLQIKRVLVLGSEVTRPSDNAAIVARCSICIKEVINQLTGPLGQSCPLHGGTVRPLTANWETTTGADNIKPKISAHTGTYRVRVQSAHARYMLREDNHESLT